MFHQLCLTLGAISLDVINRVWIWYASNFIIFQEEPTSLAIITLPFMGRLGVPLVCLRGRPHVTITGKLKDTTRILPLMFIPGTLIPAKGFRRGYTYIFGVPTTPQSLGFETVEVSIIGVTNRVREFQGSDIITCHL